jgi:hypothetical protein
MSRNKETKMNGKNTKAGDALFTKSERKRDQF